MTKKIPHEISMRGKTRPAKNVPIQVMVPASVRQQVAMIGAQRGENIRTLVLRGLQAIGVDIPDSELAERRGRKRQGDGHGA